MVGVVVQFSCTNPNPSLSGRPPRTEGGRSKRRWVGGRRLALRLGSPPRRDILSNISLGAWFVQRSGARASGAGMLSSIKPLLPVTPRFAPHQARARAGDGDGGAGGWWWWSSTVWHGLGAATRALDTHRSLLLASRLRKLKSWSVDLAPRAPDSDGLTFVPAGAPARRATTGA